MSDTKPENVKPCNTCSVLKPVDLFITGRHMCKDCNNERRRRHYRINDEFRAQQIRSSTEFKQKKSEKAAAERQIEQTKIGVDNSICKYCKQIKPKQRFRFNRLKCRECERDEPLNRLVRNVRSRIHVALKNKTKHLNEYLGCTGAEYLEWLVYCNPEYKPNSDNIHIDHVIPISSFDLTNESDQLIAFNWRNTMPLTKTQNLSKNNKIIQSQIRQHYQTLHEYSCSKGINVPQEFIELLAKHLDAGSPLEPSLPLPDGNVLEELG